MAFSFGNTAKNELYTIAFYNLENLFDTEDDPHKLDDDFTAKGVKNWNKKRYRKKIYKLGRAISSLAFDKTKKAPVLVGIAEVENRKVVSDLINSKHLKEKGFDLVHYDSPDERGIDTALIYQKKFFKVLDSEIVPLLIYEADGVRDFTRDILHVTGELNDERIHILVNHWPSRRDGAEETQFKRIEAAKTVHSIVDRVKANESNPTFLIMGDFNDDPGSVSVQNYLMTQDLYNPMQKLLSYNRGSLVHDRKWNLFDQIIVSHNLFDYQPGTHSFAYSDIFDERFLQEWKGKYKGNPFRTYVGKKYLGGYSDHFPVYIQLKRN